MDGAVVSERKTPSDIVERPAELLERWIGRMEGGCTDVSEADKEDGDRLWSGGCRVAHCGVDVCVFLGKRCGNCLLKTIGWTRSVERVVRAGGGRYVVKSEVEGVATFSYVPRNRCD